MELVQTIAGNAQPALLVAGAIIAGFGVLAAVAAYLMMRAGRGR